MFQHKFFDSGDYNMARAKTAHQKSTTEEEAIEKEEMLHESTGVTIATPESVPAVRRKSMAEGPRSHRNSFNTTTVTPGTNTQHLPENQRGWSALLLQSLFCSPIPASLDVFMIHIFFYPSTRHGYYYCWTCLHPPLPTNPLSCFSVFICYSENASLLIFFIPHPNAQTTAISMPSRYHCEQNIYERDSALVSPFCIFSFD